MSRYIILIWMLGIALSTNGQSVIPQQLIGQLTSSISQKSQQCEHLLERRTNKMLQRMERMETRMRSKLMKQDSLAAKGIFDSSMNHIRQLQTQWAGQATRLSSNKYLDTLHSALKFLSATDALKKMDEMEARMAQAEQVQAYIKLHREQLKQQLAKYTQLSGKLDRLNKTVAYYNSSVAEYKSLLHDRKKATTKALELLKKIPAYNTFLRNNERLAGLVNSAEALPGLQTRAQVQQLVNARLSQGVATSDPLGTAQAQVSALQQRLPPWRSNSSDMDMPDFKPDAMKAKSFLQRLEIGYNLQPQQSSSFWPGMLNMGGSIGYRLNEKSVIGIGGAYLLGLGRPVKNIVFSHQGVGVRSYVDVKLKGSIWISGGIEYNYMHAFSSIREVHLWQRSGLIGVTRKVKVGNKEVKTQLLWDVLSYSQVPKTAPFKFRLGYNLK